MKECHSLMEALVENRVCTGSTWYSRTVCRLRGHRWTSGYREADGYPLCVCDRCGLTERWAGGLLMDSSDWHESERLNAKDAA